MILLFKCSKCDFKDVVFEENAKEWKCPRCTLRELNKPIIHTSLEPYDPSTPITSSCDTAIRVNWKGIRDELILHITERMNNWFDATRPDIIEWIDEFFDKKEKEDGMDKC